MGIAMKQGNPYKFRLWFSNQNTDLFTDRQKRLVYHFLGWGPRGCDSWNYRLMLEFHCSRRTLQYDLRHLEKHALIDIRGALGKYRRIVAIPYPTRAAWMRATVRQTVQNLGAKFCTHQRRTIKNSINQQLDELLYDEGFLRFSGGGSSETFALELSYEERYFWELARQKLIDQLVRTGHSRESAITLAGTVIRKSIIQKGKNRGTKNVRCAAHLRQ